MKVVFKGIRNPDSSQPAGNFIIKTYYEGFMVDSGVSDGSYTPTSGFIRPINLAVVPDVTSGTESTMTLVFQPQSKVPKNGIIEIVFPP